MCIGQSQSVTLTAPPRPESEGKMSFEAWWKDYCRNHDNTPSFGTVFEAGCAESEAQIAALQSQVAILEESNKGYQRTAQTILEIKSERDALRNAIKAALICGRFDFQKFEALVSTPASGEPARKP